MDLAIVPVGVLAVSQTRCLKHLVRDEDVCVLANRDAEQSSVMAVRM